MTQQGATIVEVGPRDGFQAIGPFIPTALKIAYVERLYAAGLRRIEATAFVSDKALPQMAEADVVLEAALALPDLDVQILAPNGRHAERAIAAGASHIVFVLSVSESHNMNNVRRPPLDSVEEYANLVSVLHPGVRIRVNVATAFDCPFEGAITNARTLDILARLIPLKPDAEIALCDTTGRTTPARVTSLVEDCRENFPQVERWAFHGHDTYGLGVANVLAAYDAGVRTFDASFAGLGGCPFAPGATGNVATEDVIWTFAQMGIDTGVDLSSLLRVAEEGAKLPGALSGGRVRDALRGANLGQEGGRA